MSAVESILITPKTHKQTQKHALFCYESLHAFFLFNLKISSPEVSPFLSIRGTFKSLHAGEDQAVDKNPIFGVRILRCIVR